ncbi:hypothetical protein KGQ25_00255 [Patescibacteria group bacterium]|nr:hypothetical protein [Patescibacteria group bacterium]MDE2173070.1 hypothetical protein [Patescibacteria group bacterium]
MRKLDDIVIPSSRRREVAATDQPPVPSREPLRLSEKPPRLPYTTLVVVLLIIAISAGALFYFSGAKVEITPNSVSAAVQNSFTASQNAGNLPFEIVTAQKIATQSVEGSGTKEMHSFASGTVTIYNTQKKAQRLITNTRFATTAGLIFRIHSSVVVPAATDPTKPGNITVSVYADQAGSSYNIGPSSFTIPGLAGTPQATMVYARSSGSMTGGASGNVPIINTATETQTRAALITALTPDLAASIEAQIPAGYLLLPGAATTTYQELTPTPSKTTGMVDVREQGTITAVVFPNAALAKTIASSIAGLGYQGEPLILASTSDLRMVPGSGQMPDSRTTSFSFTLAGTASLVYDVDTARIAAAVSGKTRPAAEVALTNLPEVKRAVITLRPFWRQTFPQDPSSISVVVTH